MLAFEGRFGGTVLFSPSEDEVEEDDDDDPEDDDPDDDEPEEEEEEPVDEVDADEKTCAFFFLVSLGCLGLRSGFNAVGSFGARGARGFLGAFGSFSKFLDPGLRPRFGFSPAAPTAGFGVELGRSGNMERRGAIVESF